MMAAVAALSWAHEFEVKNRLRGDALYLNLLAKF